MKKLLSLLVSIVLCVGLMPSVALAESSSSSNAARSGSSSLAAGTLEIAETASTSNIKGTYRFVSEEETSIELTDSFVYNDDWFTGSSFKFNRHLATLSALASEASKSVFGPGDGSLVNDDRDNSQNSKNIEALLSSLGFADIATNAYYNREKEQNSAGCAMAHKTIVDDGKRYTLLAIVPRSSGYKQEWAGNFLLGKSGMHDGFKSGRDEILRFARSYISKHNISGDVKVWVCGHSRGGALANSVGAFLAKAGSAYLGKVNVDPKNIYAYTFATPPVVTESGATETQVFSVEAARGATNERYANDTKGAAFSYAGKSTVSPHDSIFQGMHNCSANYDVATMLPPAIWGFTTFGTDFALSDGTADTKDKMLSQLENLSAFAYELYTTGGDESDFAWMTYDPAALEFVADPNAPGPITMADFFTARTNALMTPVKSRSKYVSGGYQDALVSLGGILGLSQWDFFPALISDENMPATMKAGAFSYLTYAAERLQAEGKASSERDAVALAMLGLVEWTSGQSIDPAVFTCDDLTYAMAKFLVDSSDITFGTKRDGSTNYSQVTQVEFRSKTAQAISQGMSTAMVEGMPDEAQLMMNGLIPGWFLMNDEQRQAALTNYMFSLLNKMVYGVGDKSNPGSTKDAKATRVEVYNLILSFVPSDKYGDILDSFGKNTNGQYDGSGRATDFLVAFVPVLTGGKTIIAAADEQLVAVIDAGLKASKESGRYKKDSTYYNDLVAHGKTCKANVSKLREMLTYALFYDEGAQFSTAAAIRNVSTFTSQVKKVMSAHLNETYLAWTRAQDSAYPQNVHAKIDIGRASIEPIASKVYKGSEIKPKPQVKYGTKTLVAGTDYKLTYQNNVKAGTALVTVSGKGAYRGSRTTTFTIGKANIKSAKVAKVGKKRYTGKAIKPKPKIKFNGKTLKAGVDYKLTYQNNKKRGTAKIIVKGIGNFEGKQVVKFTIA